MIIQLIGARRAAILGILLVANAILAGLYFSVIGPMQGNAQMQLTSAQSEISGFQQKIQGVKRDLEIYKENLPRYEGLQATGFMMGQDRFEMGRILEGVQQKSGISGFAYTIEDVKSLPSSDADVVQMKLINSRIQLTKLGIITDSDFFNFVNTMELEFPAQLRLNSFSLKKNGALSAEVLQKISTNQPVNLVDAQATFDWITLVPKTPEDLAQPSQNGRGGR